MPDTNPPSSVRIGIGLTALGISGAVATALMGVYYAPMVDSTAFNAPEAYRILYWHVPFAWSSFLAFCMLFIGAVAWYRIGLIGGGGGSPPAQTLDYFSVSG